jgi:hypothetical protein
MLKYTHIAIAAASGSIVVSWLYDATVPATVAIAIVTSAFVTALATVVDEIVERRRGPSHRMYLLSRGVCPSCRAFGSVQEVTSDCQNVRSVTCQACDAQMAVKLAGDHLVCNIVREGVK